MVSKQVFSVRSASPSSDVLCLKVIHGIVVSNDYDGSSRDEAWVAETNATGIR